jgi:hypothetical protein
MKAAATVSAATPAKLLERAGVKTLPVVRIWV